MPNPQISPLRNCTNSKLNKSNSILQNAYTTVSNFYELFSKGRRRRLGNTSDQEQDLLRAMLLFSSAGLDAVVKQLIKDNLKEVIDNHQEAQREFEKWVESRIKKAQVLSDLKTVADLMDLKIIARSLAAVSPRDSLVTELTKTLSENSLQSKDEVLKVASHFAITTSEIVTDVAELKRAFDVRNQITHEMDINFSARNRSRIVRTIGEMTKLSNTVLSTAEKFITAVEDRI